MVVLAPGIHARAASWQQMPTLTSSAHAADTPCMGADVNVSPSPVLWVDVAVVALGAVAAWLWVRRSRNARGPSARRAVFSFLGNVTEGVFLSDGQTSKLWPSLTTCGSTCAPGLRVKGPSFASST